MTVEHSISGTSVATAVEVEEAAALSVDVGEADGPAPLFEPDVQDASDTSSNVLATAPAPRRVISALAVVDRWEAIVSTFSFAIMPAPPSPGTRVRDESAA